MRKTLIAWTASLALLAVGAASAYHIPEQNDMPADGSAIARTWTGNEGAGVITCESVGPFDPINPGPPGGNPANGGICYAASQDFWSEGDPLDPMDHEWEVADMKEKKDELAGNQTTTNPDGTWSFVQPYCTTYFDTVAQAVTSGNCPLDNNAGLGQDNETKALRIDGWSIRVGTNAHRCVGDWEQEFRYKEMLAYFHGFAPNEHGISGHVTFFVYDPFALDGSYHSGKGVDGVEALDDPKTSNFCSDSPYVGLTSEKSKTP